MKDIGEFHARMDELSRHMDTGCMQRARDAVVMLYSGGWPVPTGIAIGDDGSVQVEWARDGFLIELDVIDVPST